MKLVRIAAIVLVVYVALGLTLDAAIGYFQPQGEGTAVLRTFDEDGRPHDTVLSLHEDADGTLWVESGHWFRGWYDRARRSPEVELIRNGDPEPYRAVPVNDPEAVEKLERLMGKPGFGYYAARTMLLWAPIKPVRLEPRAPGDNENE